MPDIIVQCRNYGGAYASLNGFHNHRVTRLALFRAVITVGFQRYRDLFSPGWRNLLYRFGIGLSAFSFVEERSNVLCISSAYERLDRSEKGAMSYWYGMAFAKLIVESILSVPWLIHADLLRANGVLTTSQASNELGDLVGRGRSGDWHVLEAKGRSGAYSRSLVQKAKRQARRIVAINGRQPATTSACITSLFTQPISVLLDDPPPNVEDGEENWKINDRGFFELYYHEIIEYLGNFGPPTERKIGNLTFVTVPLFPFFRDFSPYPLSRPLPEWRLDLGLLDIIYKAPEQAPKVIRELPHDDRGGIGSDGIAIFGELPDWEVA